MFEFENIKKIEIPEGDVDYIEDKNGNTLWRYVLSCEVFSSLGYSHSTLTSFYNTSIEKNPLIEYPVCDNPKPSEFQKKWYYYNDRGIKTYLTEYELQHFTYEDLSIYPVYSEILSVNIFTVTDQIRQISAFTVLYGDSYQLSNIPSYEHFDYYGTNPHNWNPITKDTNISILYSRKNYNIDLTINPLSAGKVYGFGQYPYGSNIIISANVTDDSKTFIQWSDGNIDNPRHLIVDGNKNLTAYVGSSLNMNYHMNIPLTITYMKGY